MLTYRQATLGDEEDLTALIEQSALVLQRDDYSDDQIRGALGTVFGVDTQLIKDQTYYVVESDQEIIACGGWSKRQTLFGADAAKTVADPLLDPVQDAARIRAFFVHPTFSRRGIGHALIRQSEEAATALGFKRMELVATLSGERLYTVAGYTAIRRYTLDLVNGESMPVVHMERHLTAST